MLALPAGLETSSTFQTPWPSLPRFCLRTRGPAVRSRDGNASPKSAASDPGSARCYVTQHRVEHSPGLPFMDRIDPHEHSINR